MNSGAFKSMLPAIKQQSFSDSMSPACCTASALPAGMGGLRHALIALPPMPIVLDQGYEGSREPRTGGLTSASILMSASGLYLAGSASRAEEAPWRSGSYLGVGAWPRGLEESTANKRPSICLSLLSTCTPGPAPQLLTQGADGGEAGGMGVCVCAQVPLQLDTRTAATRHIQSLAPAGMWTAWAEGPLAVICGHCAHDEGMFLLKLCLHRHACCGAAGAVRQRQHGPCITLGARLQDVF